MLDADALALRLGKSASSSRYGPLSQGWRTDTTPAFAPFTLDHIAAAPASAAGQERGKLVGRIVHHRPWLHRHDRRRRAAQERDRAARAARRASSSIGAVENGEEVMAALRTVDPREVRHCAGLVEVAALRDHRCCRPASSSLTVTKL